MVITRCPTCDSSKITKVRRIWTSRFDGLKYSVLRLEFHECPGCGEKVYDREAMRKIEMSSPAFAKSGFHRRPARPSSRPARCKSKGVAR